MCDWHEESLDVAVHLHKDGSTPRARGTLFLDEIGAMPLGVQRALLRFLNDWEVVPIGYEGVIRPKEKGFPLLRVIAATNDPNWIALAKGQSTGRPDWSDLFYRLSRHILHISPPTAAEVDSLIEMERQAIGADGIEWDPSAKEELRERVRAGKVQGNRREIRAIARRTMQLVRGARAGIPVVNPNLVTKRELLLACPTPGKLQEYSPSAVLALMADSTHSSAQAASSTAQIGTAGGSGQPGVIDLQWNSDGYLELVEAMRKRPGECVLRGGLS
jgi:DNA-binding NtrC family response regulator